MDKSYYTHRLKQFVIGSIFAAIAYFAVDYGGQKFVNYYKSRSFIRMMAQETKRYTTEPIGVTVEELQAEVPSDDFIKLTNEFDQLYNSSNLSSSQIEKLVTNINNESLDVTEYDSILKENQDVFDSFENVVSQPDYSYWDFLYSTDEKNISNREIKHIEMCKMLYCRGVVAIRNDDHNSAIQYASLTLDSTKNDNVEFSHMVTNCRELLLIPTSLILQIHQDAPDSRMQTSIDEITIILVSQFKDLHKNFTKRNQILSYIKYHVQKGDIQMPSNLDKMTPIEINQFVSMETPSGTKSDFYKLSKEELASTASDYFFYVGTRLNTEVYGSIQKMLNELDPTFLEEPETTP